MKILIADLLKDSKIEKKIFGKRAKIITACATSSNDIKDSDWSSVNALLLFDTLTIDKNIIAKLKKCKIIVRIGVGYDNVDLKEAKKKNIIVSNVPDYGIDEVADHSIGLLISLNRNFYGFMQDTKEGSWNRTNFNISRLTNKTLGIVGLGRIGSAVAIRAKALKMKVIFFDPYKDSSYEKILDVKKVKTLRELSNQSDFISLHCPLNKETKNLINDSFFNNLKKNAILINTARGNILDLDSLRKALKNNKVRAAGLDVLPIEPPTNQNLLIKDYFLNKNYLKKKLIITPHVAFYSKTSIVEIRKKAATEALNVLLGEKAENCVNNFYD